MSGSHGGPAAPDPSMEDILASIRRILSEEEPSPHDAMTKRSDDVREAVVHDDVLDLDASMIVEDPYAAPHAIAAPEPHAPPIVLHMPPTPPPHETVMEVPVPPPPPEPVAPPPVVEPAMPAPPPVSHSLPPIVEPSPVSNMSPSEIQSSVPARDDSLVGAQSAAGVATSVSELVRAVAAKREPLPVHRGGPTIEDLVREEIRPLLKMWLDTELPPLVERLVRAEIERVVGRVF